MFVLRALWGNFWVSRFFILFEPKIEFISFLFFPETFLNLRSREKSFVTIIIFSNFSFRKLAINFEYLKIKLLTTFDLIAGDNCGGHI